MTATRLPIAQEVADSSSVATTKMFAHLAVK